MARISKVVHLQASLRADMRWKLSGYNSLIAICAVMYNYVKAELAFFVSDLIIHFDLSHMCESIPAQALELCHLL